MSPKMSYDKGQAVDEITIRYDTTGFPSFGKLASGEVAVTVAGITGDHIFEIIRTRKMFYELDVLEQIALRMRKSGAVVVDVGANIGNHTLFFAMILNYHVICLEPCSQLVELLERNVRSNQIEKHVVIYKCAAGAAAGSGYFSQSDRTNYGKGKVISCKTPHKSNQNVAVCRIDDLLEQSNIDAQRGIAAIKIDVEGAEEAVLTGAMQTLKTQRPLLIIELDAEPARERVMCTLASLDYSVSGPFGATPTYIFEPRPSTGRVRQARYRFWRTITRGKVNRILRLHRQKRMVK